MTQSSKETSLQDNKIFRNKIKLLDVTIAKITKIQNSAEVVLIHYWKFVFKN